MNATKKFDTVVRKLKKPVFVKHNGKTKDSQKKL